MSAVAQRAKAEAINRYGQAAGRQVDGAGQKLSAMARQKAEAMIGKVALAAVEVIDNGLREISELVERCNNLPMWEVSGFVEAYLWGDLNLGLLCTLGDNANYGFIWSAAHPSRGNARERANILRAPKNSDSCGLDFSGQLPLMLSDNVKNMQGVAAATT